MYRLTTNEDPTEIVVEAKGDFDWAPLAGPSPERYRALEQLRDALDLLDPTPVSAARAELEQTKGRAREIASLMARRQLKDAAFLSGYVGGMLLAAWKTARAFPTS